MSPKIPVTLHIEGLDPQEFETTHFPPVGAVFKAHKHITGGLFGRLRVKSIEWELKEKNAPEDDHFFVVSIYCEGIKEK